MNDKSPKECFYDVVCDLYNVCSKLTSKELGVTDKQLLQLVMQVGILNGVVVAMKSRDTMISDLTE